MTKFFDFPYLLTPPEQTLNIEGNFDMKTTGFEVVVPPGLFWIGDPCHVVRHDSDEIWQELLRSCDYFDNPIGFAPGYGVAAFRTLAGDGLYEDGSCRLFQVDSGFIGIIHGSQIKRKFTTTDSLLGMGHWIDFGEPTTCYSDGETIRFGRVTIQTAYQAEPLFRAKAQPSINENTTTQTL